MAVEDITELLLEVDSGHRLFKTCSYCCLIDVDGPSNEEVGHGHLVHGQGSGLVRADVVSSTHDLTGGKTLDVVLVFQHSLDGDGERDHNSEWESFWNGNDNNGNSNDEVVDPDFQVNVEEIVTFGFSSEKVDVAVSQAIDEVDEHEAVYGQ